MDTAQKSVKKPVSRTAISYWHAPAKHIGMLYSRTVAKINGWDNKQMGRYMYSMMEHVESAVVAGALKARDPFTRGFMPPGNDAYESGVVDLQDFCDWANTVGIYGVPLKAELLARVMGFPADAEITESMRTHRDRIAEDSPSSAPAVPLNEVAARNPNTTSTHANTEAIAERPAVRIAAKSAERQGLPAPLAAAAFASLVVGSWDGAGWARAFQDPGAWLVQHRVTPGKKGHKPKPSTWCPMGIARALVEGQAGRQEAVPLKTMHARFANRPELAPWRDEWDRYFMGRVAMTD